MLPPLTVHIQVITSLRPRRQCTHNLYGDYCAEKRRRALYVPRNNEARSRYHCCYVKAVSIRYSKCVSVALVIQHALRMRRIYCHLWPVWLYHIFPHYLINGTIFGGGGGGVLTIKCVLIFFTNFV
jgi:hypothetical protein